METTQNTEKFKEIAKRKKIKIRALKPRQFCNDEMQINKPIEVLATPILDGIFAYHKSLNNYKYTLTHVPTGLQLLGGELLKNIKALSVEFEETISLRLKERLKINGLEVISKLPQEDRIAISKLVKKHRAV